MVVQVLPKYPGRNCCNRLFFDIAGVGFRDFCKQLKMPVPVDHTVIHIGQ